MTLSQLLANTDGPELALWTALYEDEAKERNKSALAAKALAARRNRKR